MTSQRNGTVELSLEEKRALLTKMLQQKSKEPQVYPLSFAQQRLWILDRMEPNNNRYNISRAYSFAGPLQVEALETALQQVVTRHESLRTTFGEREGQPHQVVSPTSAFSLSVIDLQHVENEQQQAEVQLLAAEEAKRPFDLEKGPLLRVCLLQMGMEEHVLVLTIHHIVADGWSLSVLTKELTELYNAQV
ncbi:MAG: condensation domain-containing protein, partial [Tumebacillaceae bacterium]